MQYSDKVMDHFTNPRNVGALDEDSPNVGTGVVGSPECGDVLKLQIEVDEGDRIIDTKFKTFGCAAAIASGSLVSEWLMGKTVDEASALKNTVLADELGLPPIKVHCSMLAEDAVKASIEDWKSKNAGGSAP